MKSKASLIVVVLALAGVAAAHKNKLARELQNNAGSDAVNVIAQFNAAPTADDENRVAQHHGKHNGDLNSVHAMLVSWPANGADGLSDKPTVKFISPVGKIHAHLTNTAPAINAPYAWSLGLDGMGIGVAVIDSGIVERKSLSVRKSDFHKAGDEDGSRVVYRKSWIKDGLGADDELGHGTHVAGIIAGNGLNSSGQGNFQTLQGIAPNAWLIDLRVLDANGEGMDSDVISAIETAIALKSKYNIQVINLSLGRPVYESYTV